MRVGVLTSLISPWAKSVTRQMAEAGAEIVILGIRGADRGSYLAGTPGLDDEWGHASAVSMIDAVGTGNPVPLSAARQLRRYCAEHRIDVLLTLYGGSLAWMAFCSGFRPYVVYVVGSDMLLQRGVRLLVARAAYRAAARVLCNGHYLTGFTAATLKAPHVRSLYLGVDIDRFSPAPGHDRALTIVCTRGFLPVYNNENLLHALAELGDYPGYGSCVFSSRGPTLQAAQAWLGAHAGESVRRRVVFRNGVTDDEMVALVRQSDVFVSMSRSDGAATSLLEALACGVFPVLSDIPPNREWITRAGRNGMLVPLDNPQALARALRTALESPERRARAGQLNREHILTYADARENARTLVEELRDVIDCQRDGG